MREAPTRLERLLERVSPDPEFGRNIMGDLLEEWGSRSSRDRGLRRSLWFWCRALAIGVRLWLFRLFGGRRPSAGAEGGRRSGGAGSRDVRSAWRSLRRSPGHAALVVAILGVAMAANVSVFVVVRDTLLRPLPWAEEDDLFVLSTVRDGAPFFSGTFAYPDLEDYQTGNRTFDAIVAYLPGEVTLLGGSTPERVETARVSGDFFDVLGVSPAAGRFFTPDENEPGHAPVIVLSHALWRSRFGSDPGAVGRSVHLDGVLYEIVGVAPSDFVDPLGSPALWVARPPLMDATRQSRYGYFMFAFGRLAAGMTKAEATADVERITSRLRAAYPEKSRVSVLLTPLRERVVGPARAPLMLLAGIVLLLFFIACANIGNLQMSRAIGRRQEWSVRTALGAGRSRLFRHAMAEVVLLGIAGGTAGFLIAAAVLPALRDLAADGLPRPIGPVLSAAAVLFAVVCVAGFVVLCGAGPAWHAASGDARLSIRESRRLTGSLRMVRLRGGFVMAQIALSTVLLVGSVLLVRSFDRLVSVDPGVDTEHMLTLEVTPIAAHYPAEEQVTALWESVEARLRALPGVEAAGGATQIPMGSGMAPQFSYRRTDRPPPEAGDFAVAKARTATPGYFEAIGLRLLRGRFPDAGDAAGAHQVVLVSETLVREAFGGEDPIGHELILQETPQEIIGIVADVRTDGPWSPAVPMVWTNQAQEPATWMRESMIFVMRVQGDPLALVEPARRAIMDIDETIAITDVRTMEGVVATNVAAPRFRAIVTTVFGFGALVLAALGVGGVIGYGVARRRREIGVRAALGADRSRILTSVLRDGALLAATGAAAGLLVAAAMTRLLDGMLFGVSPLDPITFTIVPGILVLIALVSSLFPAIHASRIDPATALRSD